MPADLSDHFQELMDMEMFMSILVVFAAFIVPTIVRNVVEPRSPWDLPDEAYGVGVAFAGTYSDEYQMVSTAITSVAPHTLTLRAPVSKRQIAGPP